MIHEPAVRVKIKIILKSWVTMPKAPGPHIAANLGKCWNRIKECDREQYKGSRSIVGCCICGGGLTAA